MPLARQPLKQLKQQQPTSIADPRDHNASTMPNPTTPTFRQASGSKRSGITVFHSSSIQALSEAITSKRRSQQIMWLCLFAIANIACLIHLYFLLFTFIDSPNAISITYERQDELTMPRIMICQPATRLLDANSVQNVSKEYFYALELGMGLLNVDELTHYMFAVDLQQVRSEYEKIVKDNNNISFVYHNFYERHSRKCDAVFHACYIPNYQKVDCCDKFELVFTLNGFCWVSKEDSLKVRGLESMANFRFKLQFEGVTRPHFLPENKERFIPYHFGLMERLDQTGIPAEKWIVGPNERVNIQMTQKHRIMISNPEICVEPGRELKYFREYYEPNCAWEKVLFNNLHMLLNGSNCELPLVELLKPGYFVQSPCNLDNILHFFNYSDDCFVRPSTIADLSAASNSDIGVYLENKCIWKNFSENSTLPRCTISYLRRATLPPAAKETLEGELKICNEIPTPLESIFAKLQKMHNFTDEKECLPFCETYSHIYRKDSVVSSDLVKYDDALILMKYTTKEVELVQEEPRQSLAEYIAMVGGNFGLWNGASIISFTHFGALLLRCAGFNPFR